MPWRETDVMDQRIKFVAQALGERLNFSHLCAEYGVARSTGYRWLNRYHEVGQFSLLGERSRRPHHSPGKTPHEIEERVIDLRKRFGWGARKLQKLLSVEGHDIPVSTLNRMIKRNGLLRVRECHRPAMSRFEREQPNELWQMDFKGEFSLKRGSCHPLTILDDHSRFALGVFGLPNQRAESVERCLRQTFETYGVPQAMLMDHGKPWWSNTNGHGLTTVSVMLIKQGIRLYLSGIRHPQTQGKIERFHRTLKDHVRYHGKRQTLDEYCDLFASFRDEYNHVRPHEAHWLTEPAKHYQPSQKPYNPQPIPWEYPRGTMIKRLNSQGFVEYKSQRYFVCEALRGEPIGMQYVDGKLLITYRHMEIREIDIATGRTMPLVQPKNQP
jgi:transposase InsO family protein